MKGRKPKPTALKILQGNPGKRKLNPDSPKIPGDLPECPGWMGKRARYFWELYAADLNKYGLLKKPDQAAFSVYCNALAVMEAANKDIDRNGIVIFDPIKGPVKNPACSILKDAWNTVRSVSIEFGATPSSRSRVNMAEDKPENPLRAFLGKK